MYNCTYIGSIGVYYIPSPFVRTLNMTKNLDGISYEMLFFIWWSHAYRTV